MQNSEWEEFENFYRCLLANLAILSGLSAKCLYVFTYLVVFKAKRPVVIVASLRSLQEILPSSTLGELKHTGISYSRLWPHDAIKLQVDDFSSVLL